MKNEDVIDIYDCSDESFWTSVDKRVDIDDGFYLFSLNLGRKAYRTFRTMDFSANNQYLAVKCEASLMIYDYSKALEVQINETEMGGDGLTKLAEPHTKFEVADKTYDRILGQFINEEELEKSWIILQSSVYCQIHLLPLEDILEDAEEIEV